MVNRLIIIILIGVLWIASGVILFPSWWVKFWQEGFKDVDFVSFGFIQVWWHLQDLLVPCLLIYFGFVYLKRKRIVVIETDKLEPIKSILERTFSKYAVSTLAILGGLLCYFAFLSVTNYLTEMNTEGRNRKFESAFDDVEEEFEALSRGALAKDLIPPPDAEFDYISSTVPSMVEGIFPNKKKSTKKTLELGGQAGINKGPVTIGVEGKSTEETSDNSKAAKDSDAIDARKLVEWVLEKTRWYCVSALNLKNTKTSSLIDAKKILEKNKINFDSNKLEKLISELSKEELEILRRKAFSKENRYIFIDLPVDAKIQADKVQLTAVWMQQAKQPIYLKWVVDRKSIRAGYITTGLNSVKTLARIKNIKDLNGRTDVILHPLIIWH